MKTDRQVVKCSVCGRHEFVSFEYCLMKGWPVCHGYTMTLISKPSEKIIDRAVRGCIGNAQVECVQRDGEAK